MKRKLLSTAFLCTLFFASTGQDAPRYLIDGIYTADPSAHVFEGKIFIYPSHDIETDAADGRDGGHYNMNDYHVFSMKTIDGKVTGHGVALSLEDIPWAGRQLWAPDCAYKDGTYYFYFPAKDKNDVFKIGVATAKKPEGPFKAQKNPIMGSYSMDPAVFKDPGGKYYMYFGGLWGGQLQRYRDNKALACEEEPVDEAALSPKVARMSDDMLEFAEEPKDVVILDENGNPIAGKDNKRRFFEGAWVHFYNEKYYLSYSTGDTHQLCYATSDNPYGPFTYKGVILTPVEGWTTHHSIVEVDSKWYLFYHDSRQSGKDYLRNVKVRELKYNPDGTIITMEGKD